MDVEIKPVPTEKLSPTGPNESIAPMGINPGTAPVTTVPNVIPPGTSDFGATNVPAVAGTLPTVHANTKQDAPTVATRVSLADRIAHAASIVPTRQEPIASAKTVAPSGGQVYTGSMTGAVINQHVANLSKSFPSNEIHTILKLKGMDAQQAEQALTMIKAVW